MANRSTLLFSLLFIVASSLATVTLSGELDCVYSLFVRTGSVSKAGTHSTIGVTLYDKKGNSVNISNLEAWGGAMGPSHNYFEVGNLDVFVGRGACLEERPCKIDLASDGSGPYAAWYCDYVEVAMVGVHGGCAREQFVVDQWLSREDPPYELSTVRDVCDDKWPGKETTAGLRKALLGRE